jgi:hypothetical protein
LLQDLSLNIAGQLPDNSSFGSSAFPVQVQQNRLSFATRHRGEPQSEYDASHYSEECQLHTCGNEFRKLTDLRRGRTMLAHFLQARTWQRNPGGSETYPLAGESTGYIAAKKDVHKLQQSYLSAPNFRTVKHEVILRDWLGRNSVRQTAAIGRRWRQFGERGYSTLEANETVHRKSAILGGDSPPAQAQKRC